MHSIMIDSYGYGHRTQVIHSKRMLYVYGYIQQVTLEWITAVAWVLMDIPTGGSPARSRSVFCLGFWSTFSSLSSQPKVVVST